MFLKECKCRMIAIFPLKLIFIISKHFVAFKIIYLTIDLDLNFKKIKKTIDLLTFNQFTNLFLSNFSNSEAVLS
jgi:hypothetical protein